MADCESWNLQDISEEFGEVFSTSVVLSISQKCEQNHVVTRRTPTQTEKSITTSSWQGRLTVQKPASLKNTLPKSPKSAL